MPNARYMARLERVLEARVEDERKAQRPMARRLGGVLAALVIASLCFFVLKGATLAYLGVERFEALAAGPGNAPAQMDGLRLWLVGPDPVSRVVAQAFGVSAAPVAGRSAD